MQTRVKACGKEWVISAEPTVGCLLAFRDWIAEQEGDPFAGIREMVELGLPKEEAIIFIKEAREVKKQLACFSLNCPLAQRYLKTEAGSLAFAGLILRDALPNATEEELRAVLSAWSEKMAREKEPEGNGEAPASAPGKMESFAKITEAMARPSKA